MKRALLKILLSPAFFVRSPCGQSPYRQGAVRSRLPCAGFPPRVCGAFLGSPVRGLQHADCGRISAPLCKGSREARRKRYTLSGDTTPQSKPAVLPAPFAQGSRGSHFVGGVRGLCRSREVLAAGELAGYKKRARIPPNTGSLAFLRD